MNWVEKYYLFIYLKNEQLEQQIYKITNTNNNKFTNQT